MTRETQLFIVTFEHGQRAFKCVRLDWRDRSAGIATAPQWIITIAGRTVWSFGASDGDSNETVQAEVKQWWDGDGRSEAEGGAHRH